MTPAWRKFLHERADRELEIRLLELATIGWPVFCCEPKDLPPDHPFKRDSWTGWTISDGTLMMQVDEDSHVFTLVQGSEVDGDGGYCAGVAYITGGRWVAWESTWGPTGSGFRRDAFGGNEDIYIATHPETLRKWMSASGRMLCGISYPHELVFDPIDEGDGDIDDNPSNASSTP